MSTRDREPDSPGPLKYAPKWARMAAPEPAPRRDRPSGRAPGGAAPGGAVPRENARPKIDKAPPPPLRPREPPPWKHGKRRGRFEGDVAIKELRERMALAPDLPPTPPMREERGGLFGMVGRLAGLVTVAAIGAYGFVWISTPHDQPREQGLSPAVYETTASGERADAAPPGSRSGDGTGGFSPAVYRPAPVAAANPETGMPRSQDNAPAERPQLLSPVPWPTPDAGRDLNARRETPTTGTAVPSVGPLAPDPTPPRLTSPPGAETPVAPPAAPGIDREEIATLLARGRTYLANGDVVSARLAFRRAAEAGDAQAALALGGTFDPMVLKGLGVIGVAVDLAQARNWYQKAAELGSREAPKRIDQLAQSAR